MAVFGGFGISDLRDAKRYKILPKNHTFTRISIKPSCAIYQVLIFPQNIASITIPMGAAKEWIKAEINIKAQARFRDRYCRETELN
jgi:hypothetical protein